MSLHLQPKWRASALTHVYHSHSPATFETINLLNDIILEETPSLVLRIVWSRNLRVPPAFI